MKAVFLLGAILGVAVLAYAGGAGWWDIDDARIASSIEIIMEKDGTVKEVEYHVDPTRVPPAVWKAMDKMYPGLKPIAAEKEMDAGNLYYELAVEKDGRKVEAMFTADGDLYSQEIEVDPATVPEAVKKTIKEKYGDGTVTQWEVIKGPDGNIVEYHVKLTAAGKKHKILVSEDGFVFGAYYEVPAEIEVPAPTR
jgi:hypothetical protein